MMVLGGHELTKQMQTKLPDQLPLEERLAVLEKVWPNDMHYYSRDLGDKIIAVLLDNSMSKYLPVQVDKLKADVERAKEEGKIILIFQHEPISTWNPKHVAVRAVIENSGALKVVDMGVNLGMIGKQVDTDEATAKVCELIRSNADVIKAVFAGHWHSQFYADITASFTKDGKTHDALIPQYVVSGSPYHANGFLTRVIVK